MKFIAISDTHGCHRQLDLPSGDVLLHSGDVCNQGNRDQVKDFLDWFDQLEFKYKIFLRGNHDIEFKTRISLIDFEMPKNVYHLDHSGIEIENILIWGISHPLRWSQKTWDSIPSNTQILMTHQPPYSVFDKPPLSPSTGDKELLKKVKQIKPKVHLFGHIHAGYGKKQIDNTLFINASTYKASKKRIIHPPFSFEL